MILPKITIVTPSYNQAKFLEQTIVSVLKQGYPNLEYIIMDGGSLDNSVEIIKKFESNIYYWQSKADGGQAKAIYEGFSLATGEILGWVNSDDILAPGSLMKVAQWFLANANKNWVVGGAITVNENNEIVKDRFGLSVFNLGAKVSFNELLYFGHPFNQPSCFFRRIFFFNVNGFDTNLDFCFDYDLFLRFSKKERSGRLKEILSFFRYHITSKTSTMAHVKFKEDQILWNRYGRKKILSFFLYKIYLLKYYLKKIKHLVLHNNKIP